MKSRLLVANAAFAACFCLCFLSAQTINLPSSKQLIGEAPGHPQRLNSLPISMAVSPDGRYVVTVNDGYGTYESKYDQSLAVLDTQTGKIADFPDARTPLSAKQTLYSGLAFSRDGKHVYAQHGLADRTHRRRQETRWATALWCTASPTAKLAAGAADSAAPAAAGAGKDDAAGFGQAGRRRRFLIPAAIAVHRSGRPRETAGGRQSCRQCGAADAASGKIEKSFDLSESDTVPVHLSHCAGCDQRTGSAPSSRCGMLRRSRSSIWMRGTVGRKLALLKPSSDIAPGTHPCAFALSPDGNTLYVALANRDAVAAVDVRAKRFAVRGLFRYAAARGRATLARSRWRWR